MTNPLPVGTEIPPWGEIVDVWDWPMQTNGETGRTYVLRKREGGFSFLPAATVERNKEVTK